MSQESFPTGIDGVTGVWPRPPAMWSFSSLEEAETCPRRWALRRASYPNLWTRNGYPPRPSVAGLLGEIIHRALQEILLAMDRAGCVSVRDPAAVAVLRDLGGYSGLAQRLVDEQLSALEINPRLPEVLPTYRRRLRAAVPDVRMRVQEMISRIDFQAPPANAGGTAGTASGRLPLLPGSYAELELRSTDLGFAGRVDMLSLTDDGCSIVDYKTGDPSPTHSEQLRTYAVLWHRDSELNPGRTRVCSLTASYAHRDVVVDPPSDADLDLLAAGLVDRASAAASAIEERPPDARPGPEACRHCDVRQLCPEYWATQPDPADAVTAGEFIDLEATVVARNGARSWTVRDARSAEPVLLRTQQEAASFGDSHRLRFLNLLRTEDPDTTMPVVSITSATEVFQCTVSSG